jgi:hypothetical protein
MGGDMNFIAIRCDDNDFSPDLRPAVDFLFQNCDTERVAACSEDVITEALSDAMLSLKAIYHAESVDFLSRDYLPTVVDVRFVDKLDELEPVYDGYVYAYDVNLGIIHTLWENNIE